MNVKDLKTKEQLNLYGVVKRTLILKRVNLHEQKINLPISDINVHCFHLTTEQINKAEKIFFVDDNNDLKTLKDRFL